MTKTNKKHDRLLPMGELQNRPCEVDGRPALFHRWVEEDRVLLKVDVYTTPESRSEMLKRINADHCYPPGYSPEVIREIFALVEYRDGTVAKVKPELVRFILKEN